MQCYDVTKPESPLKINKANVAVVDASIIESGGAPAKKAYEVDGSGTMEETLASKDQDARWVKKAGRFYLGYELHACSDDEGYIEPVHVTAAHAHESPHLLLVTQGFPEGTGVLADKGYCQ